MHAHTHTFVIWQLRAHIPPGCPSPTPLAQLLSRAGTSMCSSPLGSFQCQRKIRRECFSVSIKTCWDSLTPRPTSRVFPQENIKCVWLSWAFPELCKGSWKPSKQSSVFQPFPCCSNIFKWSSLKDSKNDCWVPPLLLHTPSIFCTGCSRPLSSMALTLLRRKIKEPNINQL